MSLDRRRLLQIGAVSAIGSVAEPLCARARHPKAAQPRADHTILISEMNLELAPGVEVRTTAYNGQFPGPLLRLQEGRPVVVEIRNDTDRPEQLHWHGQRLPTDVDGAAEEGTPYIPAHGSRRIRFTPGPSGLRFYHTHLIAGSNLTLGQYSGQVGPVYIEPRREPGRYDREVFLTLKEFGPSLSRGGDTDMDFLRPAAVDPQLKATGEAAMSASLAKGTPKGYEVGYKHFTINGRKLGQGEPIRVKQGERVLFHVLNGSVGEIRSLVLPGHTFEVVAMDGNPLPQPVSTPVLWIGTAERVSAIVEMNQPGIWILGDLADDDRNAGMGAIVEYAGATGFAQWSKPEVAEWNYLAFGRPEPPAQPPDEVFDMIFAKDNAALKGFSRWTINGAAFDDAHMTAMLKLKRGRRYRLRMSNASDDIHPIHLHRHSFEIASIMGQPGSGVTKDVVMLGGYQRMEIDFVADNPGRTLFHCHQQLHMDFGFMCLFDYV